jgi:2-polyprenyl-3-methyl-5-hydroxy-6-metoxy-1,4-benzoquinol methylase
MSILETERETYTDVWSSVEDYAALAPGTLYLPIFLSLIGPARRGVTILDAGTGSGKAAVALSDEGFMVRTCDVTDAGLVPEAKSLPYQDACLWHDLSHLTRAFGHPNRTKADYVYCTDVLEHIRPQFTMLAIDQMLRVCANGLFMSVSLMPDSFGVRIGKSLHQSVFPFMWWKENLSELGQIVEARDLIHDATFLVRPRA